MAEDGRGQQTLSTEKMKSDFIRLEDPSVALLPRQTGIQLIGEVPWGTHFCQFYLTKQDLIDILVPYFQAGLESNEFCMWITSEPLGVEDAREALKVAVPDLDRRISRGQMEILPHTEWYLRDGVFEQDRVLAGWIAKLNSALSKGYAGLRLTGNTFWLEKDNWDDFTQYEETINHTLGNYRMLALCTYSLERCGAGEVADVVANHEFAIMKRRGQWAMIESSTVQQAKLALERALTETSDLNEELRNEIDARKMRENELHRLNRTLTAHNNSSRAMMRATDETDYLNEVCRIVIEDCGHAMVWIGYADDDERKTVRPVAYSGFEEGYLETLGITWSDTERGRGPTGTAIRTGKPSMCRNILTDPAFEPWREQALRRGYASSIVLPLLTEGKAFGALNIYSREPDPFSPDEVELLTGLADDLAYGIVSCRLRDKREQTERALRETNERLELLSNTASRLLVTEDPQGAAQALCEQVMAHLDCHAFFNYLVNSERRRLHLNAYAGISEATAQDIEWLDYGSAVCGCAARDGCRIVAEDIPNTPDPRTDLVKSFGIQAYACHPLIGHSGEVIGTLSFGTRSRGSFDEDELSLMKTVADQVATAMERLKLRQAAERRAEELEAIMEAVPALVWMTRDSEAMRIWGSRAAYEFLRQPLGQNLSKSAPEGERPAGYEITQNGKTLEPEEMPVQRSARGEDLRDVEMAFVFEDGTIRNVIGNATPVIGEDGNPRGSVAAFIDITERKQMEDALRENEEHLRLLIEHAPAALALFDTDMRYLAASKRWISDFGLPEEDLAGRSHYDIFTDVPERWKETLRRCLDGAAERADEDKWEKPDGSVQWLRWEVLPWKQANGDIGGIVIFSEDITQRKQAQEALEKYRVLAQTTRDIMLFVAMDGRIVEANGAAVLAYGYTYEEMLGLNIRDIRDPGEAGLVPDQMADAAAHGVLFETVHRRKDGTKIPVEVSSRGTDIGGQRVLMSIVRDISERKATEKQRAELYEREHKIAEVLQQALIPPAIPDKFGRLSVGVSYRPALNEAEVGGDFYDVFDLGGGKIGVLVGDVAGKGLHAAMRVAAARYSVRSYAFIDPRPSHVMTLANEALCKDSQDEVKMLTAFMAVIDTTTGLMTYASAGHEPPVIRTASGSTVELNNGEISLGIMESTVYTEHAATLHAGDSLVVVTDGITEARAEEDELFGKERMRAFLNGAAESPQEAAEGLMAAALTHVGGQLQDDAAVVVLRLGSDPEGSRDE